MEARVPWLGVLFSMALCAALAPAGAPSAQTEPSGGRPAAGVTLEGFVLAPDGSPAESAVVVSSAGGKTITDAAGCYRLEVEVPPGATSVQVTAVGNAGRSAVTSTRVALGSAMPVRRVDPLTLSLGSSCSPDWTPTFGKAPHFDDEIAASAVYDDGSGPALYVAGSFTVAGGVAANRVAKWDGASWVALGSGLEGGSPPPAPVNALAVYDDGSGPALYAGGSFTTAGGVAANGIAKWDGASWSALGSGIQGGVSLTTVRALTVYDDGTGQALYAGGSFTIAGGTSANSIAKWTGSSWKALGTGVNDQVHALAVHDDGTGPALYAGGSFTTAGGVLANRIAKWDGASWSALGIGIHAGGAPTVVHALTVYDDGTGPALYAGGDFSTAGGTSANYIAKWTGSSWTALGSGMNLTVKALAVYDDGTGPELYAGGSFTTAGGKDARMIAKWNGSRWAALGVASNSMFPLTVEHLVVFDHGDGPVLHAAGVFDKTIAVVGETAVYIAKREGSSWMALGRGINGEVAALEVYDDGSGTALYAGGDFTSANGLPLSRIARWNGSTWASLGSGMGGGIQGPRVDALAVFDDGSGPALHAGGSFATAGPTAASNIAKWNGSSWEALGSGMNKSVKALALYDDGGGPALYAGGGFTTAGGVAANRIAKWDGSSWSALGSGMGGAAPVVVDDMAVFDDGGGPALFAGGRFATAGGVTANSIAKWDGASWAPLGSGMNFAIRALAVYDDGSGPALFAAGTFTTAGGVPASYIAKWDGTSWAALGGEVNDNAVALVVYDDGGGPALYAGGKFTTAGGLAASSIAKWNGTWSALGSGVNGPVLALAAHDDGTGLALFAGGSFVSAPDAGDGPLAKWGYEEPDLDPPLLSCPSSVFVSDDFGSTPGEVVSFSVTASDCRDSSPTVLCSPPSGSFFPRGTTLVTCTATDGAGNQSSCEFPVTVALKARRR